MAQLDANAWGLYDMHGNIWEWCNDGYIGDNSGNETDPAGSMSTAVGRVIRGGNWGSFARGCRSAFRHNLYMTFSLYSLGCLPARSTS